MRGSSAGGDPPRPAPADQGPPISTLATWDGTPASGRAPVRRTVWSITGAVILLVASVQVFNLWTDYRIAIGDTRERAVMSARILSEHMRSAVATVDASLTQLSIHSTRIGGPAAATANWTPVLTAALAGMSQVGSLTVIDSTGIIRHATIPSLAGQPRRDDFLFSRLAAQSPIHNRTPK